MSFSFYQQTKHKAITGLVDAERASKCFKCGNLSPFQELHRGWCLMCVSKWTASADPWLIKQARESLPEPVIPGTVRQVEQLEARILEPIPDTDFLPLTQFMGSRGVGAQRTFWNYLLALYSFEIKTTGQAFRFGASAKNTLHLCGRHANVPRGALTGFLSRINSAGSEFKPWTNDRHFTDYMRGFISDNQLARCIFTYQKTGVDVYDRHATQRMVARYGKAHFDRYCSTHWPFESEYEAKSREKGTLDELPDVVMRIGELVPKQMPSSLREDLCQDLVVAVLSGETTVENLRDGIKYYVQQAFLNHPLKYGRYSLDQPASWYGDDGEESFGRTLTDEDISPKRADRGWLGELCIDTDASRGWHRGYDRPVGITTIGAALIEKHGGYQVEGPSVASEPEDIDPDVKEVMQADLRPRWRKKLSG